MIVAPLVIGQLLNLPAEVRTTMLAGVMFGCGIATIISSLGLGFVGARLPIVLGAYAVYIGPVVAMAKASGLAAASTAMLIGGVALFIISPIVGKMRSLFPPVVVGTLLVLTGVTLIRIAVNIAAGINTPYAGNGRAIALVLLSIGLILAINRLTQGLLRALSVFLALMCIYLCSILLGLADLSVFTRAAWFAIPRHTVGQSGQECQL